MNSTSRPSVAVIGAGISGLTAAHVLGGSHDVTLFEADRRLGGHAHTHDVPAVDGHGLRIDSGFIIHNERTYPHLLRLFARAGHPDPPDAHGHERHLRRVRPVLRRRSRTRRPVRPAQAGRRPAAPADAGRGAPLPPGGAGCAGGHRGARTDVGRVPGRRRVLPALHRALRGAPGRLRVVVGRPAMRRPIPRGTCSRSWSITACSSSAAPPPGARSSAARPRTSMRSPRDCPTSDAPPRSPPCCGTARGWTCGPPTIGSRRSTRRSSPRTPTTLCACSPTPASRRRLTSALSGTR